MRVDIRVCYSQGTARAVYHAHAGRAWLKWYPERSVRIPVLLWRFLNRCWRKPPR